MFLGISSVEWFGYAASLVVAVSLTMSSIVRLRWYNLVGACMFSTYGFIIGSLPVGLLNLFIVVVNGYFLVRLYREKADFRIMGLSGDDEYLDYYLSCHQADIERFFPQFKFGRQVGRQAFYQVKNSVPIGILIGQKQDEDTFLIELDYVGPAFRDFRMGAFIYGETGFFKTLGYKSLIAEATGGSHDAYLNKMRFIKDGDFYRKTL